MRAPWEPPHLPSPPPTALLSWPKIAQVPARCARSTNPGMHSTTSFPSFPAPNRSEEGRKEGKKKMRISNRIPCCGPVARDLTSKRTVRFGNTIGPRSIRRVGIDGERNGTFLPSSLLSWTPGWLLHVSSTRGRRSDSDVIYAWRPRTRPPPAQVFCPVRRGTTLHGYTKPCQERKARHD
ncbi:hypothetical protein BKA81DRAFT_12079 [Phyllosticta paracitricarpa]